jgi:hypothetical protein
MTYGGLMYGSKREQQISCRFMLEPPSNLLLFKAMMDDLYGSKVGRSFKHKNQPLESSFAVMVHGLAMGCPIHILEIVFYQPYPAVNRPCMQRYKLTLV